MSDDAEDEVDRLERSFKRRRQIFKIIGIVAIAGGLLPCVIVGKRCGQEIYRSETQRRAAGQSATPAQKQAVENAAQALEAESVARTGQWREGMAGALALTPEQGAGGCQVTMPLRPPMSAQRGGSFNNLDQFDVMVAPGQHAFPMAIVHGGELPIEPPRVAYARERIGALRESIQRSNTKEGLAATVAAAEALNGPAFWTYDVIYVPTEWTPPRASGVGFSYTPGQTSGVGIVFDYASKKPVCIGKVSAATTSTEIEYSAQLAHERSALQAWLDAEFDAEIERALARGIDRGL